MWETSGGGIVGTEMAAACSRHGRRAFTCKFRARKTVAKKRGGEIEGIILRHPARDRLSFVA